jgi:hypothetical protein
LPFQNCQPRKPKETENPKPNKRVVNWSTSLLVRFPQILVSKNKFIIENFRRESSKHQRSWSLELQRGAPDVVGGGDGRKIPCATRSKHNATQPLSLLSFLCFSRNKALTRDTHQERNVATAGALQKRIGNKLSQQQQKIIST